jgi:hypothetical protein
LRAATKKLIAKSQTSTELTPSTFHMLVVIVDREAIVVHEDRVVADRVVAAVVVVEAVAAAVVDAAVLVADRAADARFFEQQEISHGFGRGFCYA